MALNSHPPPRSRHHHHPHPHRQVERVKKRHANVHNEIQMERRVLSRIRHPNIVELYHSFQDYTCLYLLLELCPGGKGGGGLLASSPSVPSLSSSSSSLLSVS
jgi:serine/threonine protein kinase